MIGVKFNRAMRPYGAGDIAMLPEDVAQRVVDEGSAELCNMPAAPHAHEAVSGSPLVTVPRLPQQQTKPLLPARQGYRTKGR